MKFPLNIEIVTSGSIRSSMNLSLRYFSLSKSLSKSTIPSQQPVDDGSKKDEENNEEKGSIRLKQLKQFRISVHVFYFSNIL